MGARRSKTDFFLGHCFAVVPAKLLIRGAFSMQMKNAPKGVFHGKIISR